MINRLTHFIGTNSLKGENFFVMYGKSIHDCFYYDFYTGILSLNDTLKKYFLLKQNFDFFVDITVDTIIISKRIEDKIIEDTGFFEAHEKGGDLDGMDLNNAPDPADKQTKDHAESATENVNEDIAKWARLYETIKIKPEQNFVLLCSDFDWKIDLYKSSQDEKVHYVKRLKDFAKLKNVVIIITLEDAEKLKRFDIELEKNNSFMVGSPSAEEIKFAYLREFFAYNTNIPITNQIKNNLLTEISTVASAISASGKSLSSALSILKTEINVHQFDFDRTSFEESIEKPIDEKVTFDDIIISDANLKGIKEIVQKFIDGNVGTKGFILKGPPGTGKTYLVKAIANEFNCHLVFPTLADLKGEFIGQTSPKIKKLFDEARSNEPTLIFIDEADTIFPSRNIGSGKSDSFNLDMVNQFLVEIDGLSTGTQKILVIAATNRIEILDGAIRSRLPNEFLLERPNHMQRENILRKKFVEKKIEWDKLSANERNSVISRTNMMSGRDLKNFADGVLRECEIRKIDPALLSSHPKAEDVFNTVLSGTEQKLIAEIQHELSVEVKSPHTISRSPEDIIGNESAKKQLFEFADNMQNMSELETNFNLPRKQGVILYGPPGNAKSHLAEAMAKEKGLYFIKVVSRTLVSDEMIAYLDNINKIFDFAIQLSKICVSGNGVLLFFDEFDSIAEAETLSKVVRGTLLTCLDNAEGIRSTTNKVVLVAATNFYDSLDKAVVRQGRFDAAIPLNNPTKEEGVQILVKLANKDKTIMTSQIAQSAYEKQCAVERNKAVDRDCRRLEDVSLSLNSIADIARGGNPIELSDFIINILTDKHKSRTLSGAEVSTLYTNLKRKAVTKRAGNTGEITSEIIDEYFEEELKCRT
ncbi:hypothetical protein AGMMS49944_25470 [Spirochaetia bacterium]|nr:hypothetical protein AGMMS49944_25470 [Spirochaetia bacterium]